jgi:hypothetical protein
MSTHANAQTRVRQTDRAPRLRFGPAIRHRVVSEFIAVACCLTLAESAFAQPSLARPDRYRLELYADFAPFFPDADAFQLTFSSGEQGFSPGLFVTGGPGVVGMQGTQLFQITGPNTFSIVAGGFQSNMSMLFGQGAYGTGMLITAPAQTRILRLLADGTLGEFAKLGTPPQGPAIMAYGPGNSLFVTDRAGGTILQVLPSGQSSVFATVGGPPGAMSSGPTGLINDVSGRYGGGLVVGTHHHLIETLSGPDAIFSVSSSGTLTPLATGLNGVELLTLGPGGAFGADLFVATVGTRFNSDGAVYTLSPDGALTPFLTNIDAIHVAFDTEGVLGGGMFISDLTQRAGSGKIWRVTAIPEPATFTLVAFALAVLLVLGTSRRRRDVRLPAID